MRKLFIGLTILIGLLIASIAIIPSLIPSSVYKEKIQTQLTKELERDVTIEGDVKLSVFPSIRAKTDRVTIANPEGFDGELFAAMDGLNAKVKLWPLFSKRVEIDAFELENPVINLQKRADGTTNWTIGSPEGSASGEQKNDGPFKRDGRFANLDPAIGKFSIKNGSINYADAVSGHSYDLKEANLAFALTSLAHPVNVKGDVIFNEEPVILDLSLDTPRKFLDGEVAPVKLNIETNFAKLKADGEFTQSQDIAFVLDLDGDISDVAKIATFAPSKLPLSEIAQTVLLKGQYRFDGKTFSANRAEITANGPALNVTYKGDAHLAETPVLNGNLNLDIRDVPFLAGLTGQEIKGIDLAKTLKLTADLEAQGKGFKAQNLVASMTGQGVTADFKGTAAMADLVSATGTFNANAASIPALVKTLALEIPQTSALGNADVTGTFSMSGKTIHITNLTANTKGGEAEASYIGSVTVADDIGVDGTFDTNIASLSRFATSSGLKIPYSEAIGKINAKGAISGTGETFAITGLVAELTEGDITGKYEGAASLSNGFNLDGKLKTDISSMRKLAAMGGTTLPPSTATGQIYEKLSIAGNVKGSPDHIKFNDAKLSFDDLTGTGSFDVNLSGAKPYIVGQLDLAGLDLRPYMASFAAQNPTGEIKPWSEEPLNLDALKTIDGDFKIYTPDLITDRLTMGEAKVDAKLRAGTFTANIPQLNLYGGLGSATATLDTSGSVPSVSLNMKMADLQTNKFLSAIAGFTHASGEGESGFSVTGQGRTQAEIMRSLNGQGDFKVENGKISGVDLQQLLTGLDAALQSRTLPGGIGAQYVTEFNRIRGLFEIKNGVVSINNFDLGALGVAAKGGGNLDLGNQKIDFNLQPRLTGKSASDLASFGIPIRIQGGFGSVKAGLDTDMLGKIVAAQAQDRLQKELTDRVGGPAGSIIGGLLGSQNGQSPTGQSSTSSNPEDAVNDILGGLLGSQQKKSDPQDTSETSKDEGDEEEKKKEPSLEDALGGLFGRKD